jgi:cbb3-type cytochrome oxidase subunit 3
MITKRRLFHLWRNLSFWQRLIVESAFCVPVTLFVELVIFRSSANFGEAVFAGLFTGVFLAIIDHAFFAPTKRNKRKRNQADSR